CAKTEQGANRGPRAGSPRGVVAATWFIFEYESSCIARWFLPQDPAGRYRSRFCISDSTLLLFSGSIDRCYTPSTPEQNLQSAGSRSMKLVMLAAVGFALFLMSSCTKTESPATPSSTTAPAAKATATPDEFASARATFAKNCVACHGADGEGGLKTVDNKKLKVPSLSTGHALKHTDEDFVEQIMKGGDGMPGFKDKLSAVEINLLVSLIEHKF